MLGAQALQQESLRWSGPDCVDCESILRQRTHTEAVIVQNRVKYPCWGWSEGFT